MRSKGIVACLVTLAGSGCGGGAEESMDVEGCEHLREGPDVDVTATPTTAGAPAVAGDHMRYDVTLVDVAGGKGGFVSFAAGEAADHVFFFGANVPVTIVDSQSQNVTIEESTTSSSACAEIKGRHVVELEVGTYFLSLGPTTETLLGIVVEEARGHAH